MMPILGLDHASRQLNLTGLHGTLTRLAREVETIRSPSFEHLQQIEEDFGKETAAFEEQRHRLEQSRARLRETQKESEAQVEACRKEISDSMQSQMAIFNKAFLAELAQSKTDQ
jgi:hypothetical protein